MVARQVFYSGRVQGVGFRYTTKKIAAEFDVTGWVHNLPDGRVELVAITEDEEELDAFLAEVQENSVLANYIKEVLTRIIDPPKGVKGFSSGAGEEAVL